MMRFRFFSFLTFKVFPAIIAGLIFIGVCHAQSADQAQTENNKAKQRILFEAQLIENGPIIREGLDWRIYHSHPDASGGMKELIYSHGGSKAFNIPSGEYLVHAAYGHAGIVRKIKIGEEAARELFTLNAGGLKLMATASENAPLPTQLLKFDIYESKIGENGIRKPLAKNINAEEILTFPAGVYHVVSTFGELNAEVRADLRVEAGKLTEASLTHRAAIISFSLVSSDGGDAVADTSWAILSENGETISESNRTFPTMVLVEGNYTAIAKNNDVVYSEDFEVRSGFNETVEVKALN